MKILRFISERLGEKCEKLFLTDWAFFNFFIK